MGYFEKTQLFHVQIIDVALNDRILTQSSKQYHSTGYNEDGDKPPHFWQFLKTSFLPMELI